MINVYLRTPALFPPDEGTVAYQAESFELQGPGVWVRGARESLTSCGEWIKHEPVNTVYVPLDNVASIEEWPE